jgi:hypothetical protein
VGVCVRACLRVCVIVLLSFPRLCAWARYTTMLNRAQASCEEYERYADGTGSGNNNNNNGAQAKQLCHDMYHAPDGFELFVRFLAEHGTGFDEHVRPQASTYHHPHRSSVTYYYVHSVSCMHGACHNTCSSQASRPSVRTEPMPHHRCWCRSEGAV